MKYLLSWLLFCLPVIAEEVRIIAVNEPPASFVNAQGEAEGYVVDIVKAIQIEINNTANIEFVSEARAFYIAEHLPNVVLFSFSRTNLRENKLHWLAKVMEKQWGIFTLSDSTIVINNLADLESLFLIGVVRGDVREEWLINQGFENIYSVTQHEQNVRRLLVGRVEAIAYENQGLAYLSQSLAIDIKKFKTIFKIKQSDVYLAMSKKGTSQALMLKWQEGFKTIKENGTLNTISIKWQSKIFQELGIKVDIEDDILVF